MRETGQQLTVAQSLIRAARIRGDSKARLSAQEVAYKLQAITDAENRNS